MPRIANDQPIVALVTGSAHRTGAAIATSLAAAGFKVGVHYRKSQSEAEALCSKIQSTGRSAKSFQADIKEDADAVALVTAVVKTFGQLDILIHCIGDFHRAPLLSTPYTDFQNSLHSTLGTAFIMCKAAAPFIKESIRGRLILLGDARAGSIRATPNSLGYFVGKNGLLLLASSFAEVLADSGATVNCVSPGILENSTVKPAAGPQAIPLGKYGSTDEVCAAIHFLISDEAGYITGENLRVAGGWR